MKPDPKPTLDPNLDDDDLAIDLVREMLAMLARDARALAYGVQVVRVHPADWERMDCPLAITWRGQTIPIHPTGRRIGRVRWICGKAKRRIVR